MGWLEKLYKTYDNCTGHSGNADNEKHRLLPICHTTQNAQIEIVIDGSGSFIRASVISKGESATDIPCTEESGGRTGSKPTCHPLCDKLQYVAGDFVKSGGTVTSGFARQPDYPHKMYLDLLSKWSHSSHGHQKIKAVYAYVCKGSVITDLCEAGILPKNDEGQLLKEWLDQSEKPPEIFGVMPGKNPPEDAFVRWVVQIPGDREPKLSADPHVWKSWENYYLSTQASKDVCYVTGEKAPLAKQHPKKIRNSGDQAKLISANDKDGFTFRGRFTDSTGNQACGVGFVITQKAHNALRWLIERQGYRKDTQAIVAWSVEGQSIPDPCANSLEFLFSKEELSKMESGEHVITSSSHAEVAQDFALRLKKQIMGYHADLGDANDIIVLALDSATTGRMSINYYRELTSSEFLDRIEKWHHHCCWPQNYGLKRRFIGAPAPSEIAEAAYGRRLDDKLRNATIHQILPCIIDAASVPRHLFECCIRRASNRNSSEPWEWEKTLGIACALYRNINKEREYQMVLESDRTTRDYLYGRLLAIAERLEEVALNITGEKRATNAERLMQRFADSPYATWLIIEKALIPYKARLRTQRAGFLHNISSLMDGVINAFNAEEFISSAKLSGEFLLGYHCQRSSFNEKTFQKSTDDSTEESKELNQQ